MTDPATTGPRAGMTPRASRRPGPKRARPSTHRSRIGPSGTSARRAATIEGPAVTTGRATIDHLVAKAIGRPAIVPSVELRRPT